MVAIVRALVQRVTRAAVRLPEGTERKTGPGLLILLGVGKGDAEPDALKLAEKAARLRIFSNAEGKFDRCVLDEKGEVLVISQFTLYGDARGGRRPDFTSAAAPDLAKPLYGRFVQALRGLGLSVQTGEFGAHMAVESVNDGPVTLWLDTAAL